MKKLTILLFIAAFAVTVFAYLKMSEEPAVGQSAQDRLAVEPGGAENPVLKGARRCLENGFTYDFGQAYYQIGYPNGDVDSAIGVCTDVVIRALRYAGKDLQVLVRDDILKNPGAYPLSRWGQTKPDPNIDHRRVPNLLAFFSRYGKTIPVNDPIDYTLWKAGDIVIWDLNDDGATDHIGIVSDRRIKASDRPLVIDNHPYPGYIVERDVLEGWTIVAHFRYDPK